MWRWLPMTQRSDSCGRVHGSASEVPFPWLERVCLNRECDSEVRLTSVVRCVHTKDQGSKTDVYTSFVYKEYLELLLLSFVWIEKWRSLLFPMWSSTPRTSPWSSLWNSLWCFGIFPHILHTNWYNFHTHWYVSSQCEGTNVPRFNLAPFSGSP